jgi:photosystem II stability/assembly factor-like uncharacterized protein
MKKLIYISLLFFLLISSKENLYSQSGWVPIYSNFSNYSLTQFDFVNELIGYISCNNGKILKTTNGGYNWFEINSGVSNSIICVDFINPNTGYFGTVGGLILKTIDQGVSFTVTNSETADISRIKFINSNTGFAKSYMSSKLLKTTNGGLNWSIIYTYVHTLSSHIEDMDVTNNQTIYLSVSWSNYPVSSQTIVLKSTNDGNSFYEIYSSSPCFYRINFINENIGFISDGCFLRTSNSGNSWETIPFGSGRIKGVYTKNNGDIYAGTPIQYTKRPAIYHSSNLGLNWDTAYINNTVDGGIDGIQFVNDSVGYALGCFIGINCFLFKTTNGGGPMALEYPNNEILVTFSLSQNYPNPFNPSTTIRFDIPKSSHVKIVVYDLLGREIEELVNEERKPGSYEVIWNGNNFSSGVYFYKIISDDFVETKKMVLIK